jgi:hypothetical protein
MGFGGLRVRICVVGIFGRVNGSSLRKVWIFLFFIRLYHGTSMSCSNDSDLCLQYRVLHTNIPSTPIVQFNNYYNADLRTLMYTFTTIFISRRIANNM